MSDRVNTIDRVIAFVLEHPWALTDEARVVVAEVLARRIAGERADGEDIAAAVAARRPTTTATGGVEVIPVHGMIAPRANLLSDISGGTTFEGLSDTLRAAVAARPRAIVLDINSPGGNVAGAHEFAREVLAARAQVPIVAQAHHLMGSAAYWIGSAATEIVASPSSLVGGIGVYTLYSDISAALERRGVKQTLIAGGGEYKGEGADGGPLSDSALAHRKAVVDGFAMQFLTDVAAGRGVDVATVRDTFGKGRVMRAPDALQAGMVNRVATLYDTIARLGGNVTAPASAVALGTAAATAHEPQATAHERAAFIAEQLDLAALEAEL
jgi:signal peptide peptidase SppA